MKILSCKAVLISLIIVAAISGTAKQGFASESSFLIDIPTKDMLQYGSYETDFRFFSEGGLLSRFSFGVFRVVNLGLGWEVNKVVGTQTAVAAPPALFFKIKAYDGGMVLPAMAIGYDGQGYFYDRESGEYAQKEKGIFFVAGRELFLPGLKINAGLNINDFKESKLFGFAGLDFELEETFLLLAEYDNINYAPDARLNVGIRANITYDISVDVAGRDIISSDRSAERIVKIKYTGAF